MKEKRTYTHLKEHGEDMTHENEFKIAIPVERSTLELRREIDELRQKVKR